MPVYVAPAITADWLNAWLAALGAVFLVPGCRLAWSDTPKPHALFDTPDDNFLIALAEQLPTVDALDQAAIARTHPGSDEQFTRNVSLVAYRSRAAVARHTGDFTLTSTVTDLGPRDRTSATAHSPFDPPAPKGITIWERARSCRTALPESGPDLRLALEHSLTSGGARIKNNGLGFDYRRILSPTDPTGDVWVDPAIELLAFHGLAFLPIRGDGRRERIRGWAGQPGRRGSFTWPAWRTPLTTSAIDALLDRFWAKTASTEQLLATYASVPYLPRGQMDQTRGYASERIQ